jgi:hypothetical protein
MLIVFHGSTQHHFIIMGNYGIDIIPPLLCATEIQEILPA